jgi:hypothetical protein
MHRQNLYFSYEVSGFHSSEDLGCGHLSYDVMSSCRLTFKTNECHNLENFSSNVDIFPKKKIIILILL